MIQDIASKNWVGPASAAKLINVVQTEDNQGLEVSVPAEYVLRANTGIKDCRGQTIWEGSIVKFDSTHRHSSNLYEVYWEASVGKFGIRIVNTREDAGLKPKDLTEFSQYLTMIDNYPKFEAPKPVTATNIVETILEPKPVEAPVLAEKEPENPEVVAPVVEEKKKPFFKKYKS
jgi:hypothetical protein